MSRGNWNSEDHQPQNDGMLPWFDFKYKQYNDGAWEYYDCTCIQDIKDVRKGDHYAYVCLNFRNMEIQAYQYDDDDHLNDDFTFSYSIQMKLEIKE